VTITITSVAPGRHAVERKTEAPVERAARPGPEGSLWSGDEDAPVRSADGEASGHARLTSPRVLRRAVDLEPAVERPGGREATPRRELGASAIRLVAKAIAQDEARHAQASSGRHLELVGQAPHSAAVTVAHDELRLVGAGLELQLARDREPGALVARARLRLQRHLELLVEPDELARVAVRHEQQHLERVTRHPSCSTNASPRTSAPRRATPSPVPVPRRRRPGRDSQGQLGKVEASAEGPLIAASRASASPAFVATWGE
jgi:hypothetical protein